MATRALRLGTRRSVLARAQSGQIARRLTQLHPGLAVELVGIETRGDRILDQPLSSVDGKEFFTAEIDAALLDGRVDLTVHSFKDLSLARPDAIALAAVPPREQSRDIVLFAPDVMQRLAGGATLDIGSSSPRRTAFVPDFLHQALPHGVCAGGGTGGAAAVRMVQLRGNVDTRLRRLLEPAGSERRLDGVVLAFAGLARLWRDEAARIWLRDLMARLPRMVLPLSACPAAPAQGALAVECRAADAPTRELLRVLDDAATRVAIAAERELLAARGGGCHQQFGATRVQIPGLGGLLYLREADDNGIGAPQLRWSPSEPLPAVTAPPIAWDGTTAARLPAESIDAAVHQCEQQLMRAPALFVAHQRALPDLPADRVNACRHIWVPGTSSWFALARRGVWVEGCADSLGFGTLQALLAEGMLQLPVPADWTILTHEGAEIGWNAGTVIATYRHRMDALAAGPPACATHLFWASSAQFERWRGQINEQAHHASGPGKTHDFLRRHLTSPPSVFPSVRQWHEWLSS